jgi:4-amino-4-deoxy-L-arabinose transferase-like glycosyltransferase
MVTSRAIRSLLTPARRHLCIIGVMVCFALTPLLVPMLVPAAVGDDWVYARSVEILVREGRLHILDLSVVTLLFQIAWGSLFATLFGLSFGVLHLSTFVMTMLGGVACYGLCRELEIAPMPSALAAAAYVFNPLSFVLAYTFMSDPFFTALLVVATYGYVRGLRRDRPDHAALLFGAVATACAFLVRQQGALIPAAVIVALLVQRRLHRDRESVRLVLWIVALPTIATAGYYLWLVFIYGVPHQQASFTHSVISAGWEQSLLLIGRMTFIEAMYVGLFTLPVALAALSAVNRIARVRAPVVWFTVLGWAVMLLAGLMHFNSSDNRNNSGQPFMPRMPYIAQYMGPNGLGPTDLLGGRDWIVSWQALDLLTALCVVASLLFVLTLVRQIPRPVSADPSRTSAGLVLAIALGQVAGVLPPSFHFRNWIISVDRYLLPLLPLALCLGFWALRGLRPSFGAAWVIVAMSALISIAGTRDFLEFQNATWQVARAAIEGGVPVTALDAGSSWDGYTLYDYSVAHHLAPQTPGGPWWTNIFAPATTSDYIVSTAPLDGYQEVGHQEVPNWLDPHPTFVYLLQRAEPAP